MSDAHDMGHMGLEMVSGVNSHHFSYCPYCSTRCFVLPRLLYCVRVLSVHPICDRETHMPDPSLTVYIHAMQYFNHQLSSTFSWMGISKGLYNKYRFASSYSTQDRAVLHARWSERVPKPAAKALVPVPIKTPVQLGKYPT